MFEGRLHFVSYFQKQHRLETILEEINSLEFYRLYSWAVCFVFVSPLPSWYLKYAYKHKHALTTTTSIYYLNRRDQTRVVNDLPAARKLIIENLNRIRAKLYFST